MKDGFIKVAAGTPDITVADCKANRKELENLAKEMAKNGAKVIVFPELCITGYECRDLFWQNQLLKDAGHELKMLAKNTADLDALIFAGLPVEAAGKLYNTAVAINKGKVLGFVPKINLPTYDEFYELRNFAAWDENQKENITVRFDGEDVPFGANLLFRADSMPRLIIGTEICEDLWVPKSPSISHCLAGATVMVNLSASDEIVGKDKYRRELVTSHSASCICGYIYADAGNGESSTDLVFGSHNIIAENGAILAEAEKFNNEIVYADIDVDRLVTERRSMTSYPPQIPSDHQIIEFHIESETTDIDRTFPRTPFVPSSAEDRDERCEEILNIQALGLKKRIDHTHCKSAVVGISGGLDSTLALLVTAKAFDLAGIPRANILSVTMPCFGTTDRTYNNAVSLTEIIGATLKEIPIEMAVTQHFSDIGQNPDKHDVTYENCQARERTQILMDLANKSGGMVIGTGDLSELALGWATYNGDHMSMYAVNSSVPKTLVRHLVKYYAETCGNDSLKSILIDILDTPVSPELLPPTGDGSISQKTEDLVGPYELHDFYLYYMLRLKFPPKKILRIAKQTFAGVYTGEVIQKWLITFCKRFFAQQYKRSCLPDGPKVGSISISPRGNLRMPSDAESASWIRELSN